MKTIYFDMDGTIADLYQYDNWLKMIIDEKVEPYTEAKPIIDIEEFNSLLEELKNKGYQLGIISWTAKNCSQEYKNRIRKAKKFWLNKYVRLSFDNVHIIQYGYSKRSIGNKGDTLIDDDIRVLRQWQHRNDRIGLQVDYKITVIDRMKELLT